MNIKARIATGCFIFLCGGVCYPQPEGGEAKRTSAAMSQAAASRDVQAMLRLVPEVERLWKSDPDEYLHTIKQIVPQMRTASGNASTPPLMLLFTNVLEKSAPEDISKAITYYELKRTIILDYLNLKEIRDGKPNLLKIARFIGEVRSHLIANYQNRGTPRPGLEILIQAGVSDESSLTNVVQKEAYEKAVKENQRDMLMNRLQMELRSTNEILTFHVVQSARRLTADNSDATKFLEDLTAHAHFNDAERVRLRAQ